MRLRSIVVIAALAAGALTAGAPGATAADPNKITSLGTGYLDGRWANQTSCSVPYGPVLYFDKAIATGPYFAAHRNKFWTGTAKVSVLSGAKTIAKLTTDAQLTTSAKAGRSATVFVAGASCATIKTLLKAGLGRKATTYTVRLDSASFKSADKVAHAVKGGVSKKLVMKQMIRPVAISRAPSGSKFLWKGKVQVWKSTSAGYAWGAAPAGVAVKYRNTPCDVAFSTATTGDGGAFSALTKKFDLAYLLMAINATKTRGSSVTEAVIERFDDEGDPVDADGTVTAASGHLSNGPQFYEC